MSILLRFLYNLLIRTPIEILIALLRLLFLLILFLLILLLRLWEWLLRHLRDKDLYPEETKRPCGRLPEAIIRRPDPCIYSQRLLQSQGLPVTWNNPDIWVAPASDPSNVMPDSYHLVEDTDYIVTVQVHNASATDPAIGVRVRLNYRPWSFNSPDLTPVEIDAGGNEVFRFANAIAPMSAETVQFNWHTPKVDPGQEHKHFCLQASVFHPMDTNTSNNMGQENTNVHRANPGEVAPGETVNIEVPLFNYARKPQVFRFAAAMYEVNEKEEFELELKTTRGYARWSLSQRLANIFPTLHLKRRQHMLETSHEKSPLRFDFQRQSRHKLTKSKYVSFEAIKKEILGQQRPLPPGMTIAADGLNLDEGVEVNTKEMKNIEFEVKTPDDATPGAKFPLNIIALGDDGVLAGGITLILHIKEGD